MSALLTLLMVASVAWVVAALLSTASTVRHEPRAPRVRPGISLLRPLAGADPSLEQNLESLFRQAYPTFEILLGVESSSDPAWALAERVRARFPHVPSRIVATGDDGAKNPKVRNLIGLLPVARFDLVVVSDSNVSVPEGYLDDLVATRELSGAGLVTSLISCEGEEGLFGAVECAQIVGSCAPSTCLPTALGHAAVIGKSMLFSRVELESLGGLRKVADVLAEDFVQGKMYEHAGKRVAVASRVISNVTGRVSASTCFARQRCWAALRCRLSPVTFVPSRERRARSYWLRWRRSSPRTRGGIGQFYMFLSANIGAEGGVTIMWAGLTALIIGNGFFKPNISTMVGQLYPEGDGRIDSAFTIFYMGINLGAFFSPLICGSMDFKWGFLAACLGMVASLVSFILFQKKYLISEEGKEVGLPVKKLDMDSILMIIGSIGIVFFMLNFKQMFKSEVDVISYFIYVAMIIMPLIILTDKSLTKLERNRIIVIFILAFFVIFFWGAFEQAGASLTLFADRQTERTIFGWEMPASYFQSVNPLAVIILAAGRGTRMKSTLPKVMHELAGRPLILWLLETVNKLKPARIAVVTAPLLPILQSD